ncbi:glycoside hydrolase family 3 C-terminal domain-containing protein [Streptomyces sp. NPDC002308]
MQVRFAWVTPEQAAADVKAAVALARRVHTPVVFAFNGTGGTVGSTAETGSLALPSHQDDLITAVANADPRTVVVLTVGGPVELLWRKKVAAILHAGYTGQEGGWAVADLLLGRANPSGRVIVTYPDKLTDHPVHEATARQLSYWGTARSHWVRTTGRRNIYVGASSRDIRLTGTGR